MSEDLENKEIIFSLQDSDTKKIDNNDSEFIINSFLSVKRLSGGRNA